MEILSSKLLSVLLLALVCRVLVTAEKLKLASESDCDRQSLHALYYESFAQQTENALSEVTEFVNRVVDLMVDSLTSVMADLPGRESSDVEEKRVFTTFNEMKKKFLRSVNKLKANVTSAWESFITSNHNIMLDNGLSTLQDVINRTNHVADVYSSSRSVLDTNLGSVVSSLKEIVRHSMEGISTVASKEIEKEAAEKSKNSSTSDEEDAEDEAATETGKVKKDGSGEGQSDEVSLMKDKKKEIVKMIAPEFLGKVSVLVIDKDIDLAKNVDVKSENRDSVLDDMCFTLIMIRSRVSSILHQDAARNKESRDLARRNLYIHWADKAKEMHQNRIARRRTSTLGNDDLPRKQWEDENKIAETLVNLMQKYP